MRRLTADTAMWLRSAAWAMLCSSTAETNNCSVNRSKRRGAWLMRASVGSVVAVGSQPGVAGGQPLLAARYRVQLILIQRMSCASPIGQNRTSCTFVVNGPYHFVL